jgi:hypothetical protein
MTLQELIELAILDAMGLLDEEERLAFELAFRAAAPSVQAQVRREQTRLSRLENILPNVTPPAGLRAAVVQAVRREIATAEAAASDNPALMIADSMVKPRGVSSLWRAASLGLAAAALVLGVTTFKQMALYEDLRNRIQNDTVLEVVNRELGPLFVKNVLFSKDTRRIVLTPKADNKGVASVWVNSEWKDGFFFCNAMPTPKGMNYKIAIVDKDNNIVRELASFESDGELKPLRLQLSPADTGRLAVGTPGANGTLDSIVAEGNLSESSL